MVHPQFHDRVDLVATGDVYVDRASIQEELALTRRLCKQNGWPMIDVSKRSVEETAAAILALLRNGS